MRTKLFNFNFILILIGNTILISSMPMLIILSGLSGALLAPHATLAMVPFSVQVLSGLVAAAPMSLFMGKYGRKAGFLMAAFIAFLGGILAAGALFLSNFWLLCFGCIFRRIRSPIPVLFDHLNA